MIASARRRAHRVAPWATLATCMLGASCASPPRTGMEDAPRLVPVTQAGQTITRTRKLREGYLDRSALPDSAAWLPPPPQAGSAAFADDLDTANRAHALRGSPRWRQAILDADLDAPQAPGLFACALGMPIDARSSPRLTALLERTLVDAAVAGSAAKKRHQRPRPFMVDGQPSCTPDDEAGLRKNGSYPSGHAAIGWAWALVLGEVAPDRATALLQRGRSFGESRLVCNVHWRSDIDAGRDVGGATVALLNADDAFRADLAAARAEVAAMRARGARPDADCAAESAALATGL